MAVAGSMQYLYINYYSVRFQVRPHLTLLFGVFLTPLPRHVQPPSRPSRAAVPCAARNPNSSDLDTCTFHFFSELAPKARGGLISKFCSGYGHFCGRLRNTILFSGNSWRSFEEPLQLTRLDNPD